MASRQTASADSTGLTGRIDLLLRALSCQSSPDAAWKWWQQWRDTVDLDSVSWKEMQILPMLNSRLAGWLQHDASAGILHGIVRRAWTETQIRLRAVNGVAALLEGAGCSPVLPSGAAAIALACQSSGAIRPLPDLRVRVPREHLDRAAAALRADGWIAGGALPQGDALDHLRDAYHEKSTFQLFLEWRPIPVAPNKARRYEQELARNGPEHLLLAALCARVDADHDVIPWQADAAVVPLGQIDWVRFAQLAATYAPIAFERLNEISGLGVAAPPLDPPGLTGLLNRLTRRLRFR